MQALAHVPEARDEEVRLRIQHCGHKLLILTCLAYDNFPFRWAVLFAESRPAHFHLAATPRAEGELES